jgi:hypothetical protein
MIMKYLTAHPESEYMSQASGNRVVIGIRVGKWIHIYDSKPIRMALVRTTP